MSVDSSSGNFSAFLRGRWGRFAACVGLGLLAVYALFTAACCVVPLAEWGAPDRASVLSQPCDFRLRYNEVLCFLDGVNPFDVWHGDVVKKPFFPNVAKPEEVGAGFTEMINAYPPWEYVMMSPFALLARPAAWGVYLVLMFGCLLTVFLVGTRWAGNRLVSRPACSLWGTLPILAVAYPLWSNFCIGNFAVVVLAALVLMGVFLDRGWDVPAGFCWAVAMVKPQLGILFAVPLLLRRKFVTCAVAFGVCVSLTLVASAVCGTSPVKLILQATQANAFAFRGCGTWPFAPCALVGEVPAIAIGLVLGFAVCLLLTHKLRAAPSWLVYLMPTAVCATTWTYASTYGHVLNGFLFFALLYAGQTFPADRTLVAVSVGAALFSTRLYAAFHGLTVGFPEAFSRFAISETLHARLDAINSTADLILASVLVFWLSRRLSPPQQQEVKGT